MYYNNQKYFYMFDYQFLYIRRHHRKCITIIRNVFYMVEKKRKNIEIESKNVKARLPISEYERISLAFCRVSTRNEDETGTGKQDSCRVIDPPPITSWMTTLCTKRATLKITMSLLPLFSTRIFLT